MSELVDKAGKPITPKGRPAREVACSGKVALHIEVKSDRQRPTIATGDGDMVLGKGSWIVMPLTVWQDTLRRTLAAADDVVSHDPDRRN